MWWKARFCWGFAIFWCVERGELFPRCGGLSGKGGLLTDGFWVLKFCSFGGFIFAQAVEECGWALHCNREKINQTAWVDDVIGSSIVFGVRWITDRYNWSNRAEILIEIRSSGKV